MDHVLEDLPHLNLSKDIEQCEKDPRVGGGQFDLFCGYSQRHKQHVAIRRLRYHLQLGKYTSNVSTPAGFRFQRILGLMLKLSDWQGNCCSGHASSIHTCFLCSDTLLALMGSLRL